MTLQSIFDVLANNETLLICLGVFSAITFVASLILVPFLVVRIPTDYFVKSSRELTGPSHQPALLRWTLFVFRNVLGVILILLGIAMLVLPGQGLLTILIGVLLVNFPGKYRFERWLIQQKSIYRAVDWLRKRAHKPSLKL